MKWISTEKSLPKKMELLMACIQRDGGHRMVRVRQMGKPNEWFDEYDRSTMSMKQVEENVTHYCYIDLPPNMDNVKTCSLCHHETREKDKKENHGFDCPRG